MMHSYAIIGMTGQGKSVFTQGMITHPQTINRPCLVFDVQNEYGETKNVQINGRFARVPSVGLPLYNEGVSRSRYASPEMDMDDFLEIAAQQSGSNIIFEEATNFFEGRTDRRLTRLVIGKRHTMNNYIFVFHLIEAVPPKLFKLLDYLVLFKTQDNVKNIERKYGNERLVQAFLKQKQKTFQPGTIVKNPEILKFLP